MRRRRCRRRAKYIEQAGTFSITSRADARPSSDLWLLCAAWQPNPANRDSPFPSLVRARGSAA